MKILHRTVAIVLSAALLIINPIQSIAAEKTVMTEEKENIIAAVCELEEIMDQSYERTKKEVAELSKEGYDYELTMESMEIQGKPYADFDYRGFLAAYAAIRAYAAGTPSFDIGEGINRIPFIGYEYEKESTYEYIPVKRDRYVLRDNGLYVKDGIYFITEPCETEIFTESSESGYYEVSGTEFVQPEAITTTYANVTLSMIELDEVYVIFGLDREDFEEEEDARLERIAEIMGDAKIEQNGFFEVALPYDTANYEIVYAGICMTRNPIRQAFLAVASSIIGRVPYEWGGKSEKPGVDATWYTFDESGRQKGLDCSGFTQWVMRTAGYDGWENFGWTGDYLDNEDLDVISHKDLQPGDFGLFYPNTDQINHIGIYLGNGYWIHCSSSLNTVSVNNNMKFSVFRRLKGIDDYQNEDKDSPFEAVLELAQYGLDKITETHQGQVVEDPDIMLMAKIVQLESHVEGYNGWIAVAEVIRNRILSKNFPNTVYEVVSAPRQFATYAASQEMDDDEVDERIIEVCKGVLNGSLAVLDCSQVIGFRTCRPEPDDFTFNGWERYMVLGNHSFYLEEP